MDHEGCRTALLDDLTTPEVEAHLATCAKCDLFAESLRRVDASAATLVAGAPPAGLVDRVIERVHEEVRDTRRRPEDDAPAREHRFPGLRLGLRRGFATAAAAAVLIVLVVGAIAVFRQPEEQRRGAPLLIVARSTAAQGSARFDLEIDLSATTRLGQVDTFVARSVALAQGTVQFPDRLEMDLRLRHFAAFRGLYERSRFHRIVIGDRAYQRAVGENYKSVPTGQVREPRGGIVNQALFEPTRVLDLLRSRRARVVELDPTTFRGEPVQRFIATIPSDLYRPPFETTDDFSWSVELWVGARDDVLRRFTMSGTGTSETDNPIIGSSAFDWNMQIDLELSDFGVPISITPPRLD
jgi:hypothetical protein